MDGSTSDAVEKQIEMKAPVARVWRALADHREFGEWFLMKVDAPFAVGKVARCQILHPGYEHLTLEITIQVMEPERLFAFAWHPYAIDPKVDYSSEPMTRVEIRLAATGGGTLVTVRESGFDAIPKHRRAEAFRMNDQGWTDELKNLEAYVTGQSRPVQHQSAHSG